MKIMQYILCIRSFVILNILLTFSNKSIKIQNAYGYLFVWQL
ncbi:hypothetical protein SLVCU150_0051 [Staphylococcus lugdunensis VCU150]|uniref:Uncharacterized protein n=1 Tax=Staphylococcus lugdunensis TaxID=28035 RepID=A0ABD4EEE9_STALU|nr:hypothetical protein HMPREF0790_0097 [Staphylococcus lugdunensis M23590]EHS04121.1 hypothetical protein SEVCU139_0134 [Staphylococcus lugdunensis VCU139]KAK55508.1 hypothetical protein SLVCU150_0051 [Staphylococcus lugdunensis VCU150]KAK63381.1 hypothetical protein SLVCU148_0192 [Staphylococcus lugdunensis VCU148]KXA37118.1 hypothetical protein HMPREF3225_02072 [Staphylococcus lugdunensis]